MFDVSILLSQDDTLSKMELTLKECVSCKRGIGVYKVVGEHGKEYALKVALPNDSSIYNPNKLVYRESQILRELKTQTDSLLATSGVHQSCYWLLTHWMDGKPIHNFVRDLRNMPSPPSINTQLRSLFKKVVAKVQAIHTSGYLHGDIQPPHFIIDPEGSVQVIDFALSSHINKKDFNYKGALVHFVSPEVASGMLKQNVRITYDLLSEIYSLGSMFFFLYTGRLSPDYGVENPRDMSMNDKLLVILSGKLTPYTCSKYERDYALEALLSQMLCIRRQERCSSLNAVLSRLDQT